jgi:uncharacterized protein (TIGR02246 family)
MAHHPAASLEEIAERFFSAVDALDTNELAALITDDGQGVDQVGRSWRRGRSDVAAYFNAVKATFDDVRSELRDVQASDWGETGVVTCVLDQSYTVSGREERVTAPTSIICRRVDSEWRIALFHSVPIAERGDRARRSSSGEAHRTATG